VIYTSTMNYRGFDRHDITVKSASPIDRCFAPTWDIVMGIKNNTITWDEYVAEYYRILNDRMKYNLRHMRRSVNEICNRAYIENVTLVCFCKDPAKCHRSLLAHWLVTKCTDYSLTYAGERILQ